MHDSFVAAFLCALKRSIGPTAIAAAAAAAAVSILL